MNYSKMKIMTPGNAQISVDSVNIQIVTEYNYLGHIITLVKENRER